MIITGSGRRSDSKVDKNLQGQIVTWHSTSDLELTATCSVILRLSLSLSLSLLSNTGLKLISTAFC